MAAGIEGGGLPAEVATDLRLQRTLQGPVGDQDLVERLERAGVDPGDPELFAAARVVAGVAS